MFDILTNILSTQEYFQKKYNYNVPVHMWASAMMTESGELWAISGGKWWKKYLTDLDTWGHFQEKEEIDSYLRLLEKQNKDKILEESIDVFHFLLGCWLRLGLTAKDIYEAYNKKMGVNINRQKTNY